ncbi:terminase large subunit [Pseudolactococcus raffinolactis]|uniref:terminase large subunit domain-containing protein n=1 Tax=Pseudolactococcus raffinolactis TaxID=1366 RepID=UPI0014372E7A|nr:terminase large subunit [Lactococcus raffinolactis]QIW56485.1 terminase large subunit [Lactococcus raffinolactis]
MNEIKSPHFQTALQFANDLISGRKIANAEQVQACQRFLDDLQRDDLDFKSNQFDFAIDLIEGTIYQEKGENVDGSSARLNPIKLTRWEIFVTVNLFGFFIKNTNIRRYQEVLLFLPRKSGKTTFVASLTWAKSLIDADSGATTYIVANSLSQAKVSFNFIQHNLNLSHNKEKFKPRMRANNQEHSINVDLGKGHIEIRAIGADEKYLDGLIANTIIADEVHAFKRPKRYTLMKDAMKSYSGSRMLLAVSTAGDNIGCFLDERVELLKKVLNKTIKDESKYDRYFIYLCTAPRDNKGNFLNPITGEITEIDDAQLIEAVNPSAGETVSLDLLVNDAKIALDSDEGTRNEFKNKTLNVFTASSETFFDIDEFKYSDSLYDWSIDDLLKLNLNWYGYADLSVLHDLSASGLYANYKYKTKDSQGNKITKDVDIVISQAYFPLPLAIAKAQESNMPLQEWQEEGWATLSQTDVVQPSDITGWFVMMKKMGFKIKQVNFDKKSAMEFAITMRAEKFKLKDASQLPSIKTVGIRRIENKVKNAEFYYLHNRSYEYCVSNVRAEELYNGWLRIRKISKNMKIDLFDASTFGAVAMLEDMESKAKVKNILD